MANKGFENIRSQNMQVINDFIEERAINIESIKTLKSDRYCLRKFANFLGDINLKDATEEQLKEFFKNLKGFSGRNLIGIKLNVFYRWIDVLSKRETPERMKWFEYSKKQTKDSKQLEKELITPEEYNKIIDISDTDKYGQWTAIWECFYLSGARLGELASMKIKDVEFNDNKVTLYLRESKTKTREVPLSQYPFKLERWYNNHPLKDNPESPLWIALTTNHYMEPLKKGSIASMFWQIKKKTDIKQNLSVHNFRKTRATKMFNKRAKDGGLIYTDKQLALFFGWSLKTVADRREQYDLNGIDQLKKTIFQEVDTDIDTYDIQKKKFEKIKDDYEKKLKNMERLQRIYKKELDEMKHRLDKIDQGQSDLEIKEQWTKKAYKHFVEQERIKKT